MRVLVLGATGQLGSNLVRALLEHGKQVRALVRPMSRQGTLAGLAVERVEGDLSNVESLCRACDGVQVVYHAAAYYPPYTVPVATATSQALGETKNVLDAVRRASVDRLVFGSTLTTIGFPREPNRLADETCPFTTAYRNNPYLMAKAAMEDAVLACIAYKFAGGTGTFRDGGTATAWRDGAAVQAGIPVYSEQAVAATIAYCDYVYTRYGRFPANSGPFRTVLAYQAHHLDLDFYDAFFKPGAYTATQQPLAD